MNKEIGTLKSKVEYLLKIYPQARNSDALLTAHFWNHHHKEYITSSIDGKRAICLENISKLTREDQISRVRRYIQNVENKYPPTVWEIAEKRGIKQEAWRSYYSTNDTLFSYLESKEKAI